MAVSILALLLLVTYAASQEFGEVFNKSSAIVTILNEEQARSYDNREASYLVEQKWYIGGNRVRGDAFQSVTYDKYEFDRPSDFALRLEFPSQNVYYITHISCLVEQSSSIGRAYVTDGGVGKDYMTLIIEAKQTSYFYYKVYVYGRNYQYDAREINVLEDSPTIVQ